MLLQLLERASKTTAIPASTTSTCLVKYPSVALQINFLMIGKPFAGTEPSRKTVA
jgi:hypothetical protein